MYCALLQYHRERGGAPMVQQQEGQDDDLVLLAGTLHGKLNIGLNVRIVVVYIIILWYNNSTVLPVKLVCRNKNVKWVKMEVLL